VFNLQFEVEHIVPPNKGGRNDLANFALACRSCNLFKSDRVAAIHPATGTMTRLYNPRSDDWSANFRALESAELEPLTDVALATIQLLRLNDAPQVEARRIWMQLGLFP
jgi:hypothetical protein